MNHSHLGALHLLDHACDDQVLATAFRATEDKVLVLLEQRLNHSDVLLDRWRQNEGRLFRVHEIFELQGGFLLDE